MKLYYAPSSPFARKVRVAIFELELQDQIDFIAINPWTDQVLRTFNPLAKVPTLVLDDQTVVFESVLICEYLNTLQRNKSLYPKDQTHYFQNMQLQALADGAMTAMGRLFAEYQKEKQEQSSKMIQRFIEARLSSLQWLEQQIDQLSQDAWIGEISVACFLEYITFRFPNDAWQVEFPKLAEWLTRFGQRDSMQNSCYKIL